MKKFIMLLVLVFVLVGTCACSLNEKQEKKEQAWNLNPMFVQIGETIEINGEVYSASQIVKGYDEAQCTGYFIVNRINRQVYYMFSKYPSPKAGFGYSVNTGLIYEGPLNINGIPDNN